MHRLRTLTHRLGAHHKAPVFATSLAALVARDAEKYGKQVAVENFAIPWIVRVLLDYLSLRPVVSTEGIFRLAGFAKIIKELRQSIDKSGTIDLSNFVEAPDIHNIANVLKLFIREISEGLIPEDHLCNILRPSQIGTIDNTNIRLRLYELPKASLDVLNYLCRYLLLVASYSAENRMTIPNLIIVFAPNLVKFGESTLNSTTADILRQSFQVNKLLETLLSGYHHIFDEVPELAPLEINYAICNRPSAPKLAIDVGRANTHNAYRTWFDPPKSAPLLRSMDKLLAKSHLSMLEESGGCINNLQEVSKIADVYPSEHLHSEPSSPVSPITSHHLSDKPETIGSPSSTSPCGVNLPPTRMSMPSSYSTHNLKDLINASVSASLLTSTTPCNPTLEKPPYISLDKQLSDVDGVSNIISPCDNPKSITTTEHTSISESHSLPSESLSKISTQPKVSQESETFNEGVLDMTSTTVLSSNTPDVPLPKNDLNPPTNLPNDKEYNESSINQTREEVLSPEEIVVLTNECELLELHIKSLQQADGQQTHNESIPDAYEQARDGLSEHNSLESHINRLKQIKERLRAPNALPSKKAIIPALRLNLVSAKETALRDRRSANEIMIEMERDCVNTLIERMTSAGVEQERKRLKRLLNELRPYGPTLLSNEQARLKLFINRYKILREKCATCATPNTEQIQQNFGQSSLNSHMVATNKLPSTRNSSRQLSEALTQSGRRRLNSEQQSSEVSEKFYTSPLGILSSSAAAREINKENSGLSLSSAHGYKYIYQQKLDEEQYDMLMCQKRELRARLLEYEDEFKRNYGRSLQTEEDKQPIAKEYRLYLKVKNTLRDADRENQRSRNTS